MPASGGSLSDTNVSTNKVVDGQSHYLAYITPDEGKSLMDQGGKETITDSGIPAYPPGMGDPAYGGNGSSSSGDGGYQNVHQTGAVTQTPGKTPDTTETKDSLTELTNPIDNLAFNIEWLEKTYGTGKEDLITKVKNNTISKTDAFKLASKLGWVTDNAFVNAIGGAVGFIGTLGSGAQKKAITWDLNRKLTAVGKQKDFHPGSHSMQIQDLQDKMERANLPSDHPDHYGQNEYMKDYPGVQPAPDDGGNARGLTNIITPYAAHAIGGTTQQPSQAAQWYANLGSGNTNPGAFDLTTQYAKAKAAVSQRLQNTSSVGQIAVADSAFFNFLKDNSLNKGIL